MTRIGATPPLRGRVRIVVAPKPTTGWTHRSIPKIGDEHHIVLRVQRDAMGILQMGIWSLQEAKGLVLSGRVFVENIDSTLALHGDEDFLPLLVHRKPKGLMARCQHPTAIGMS